jgi:hypothetical protein
MTHPGLPRRESVHPVQRRAASAPHVLDVQSQAVPSRSEPALPRPARRWRRRLASADRRQPGRTARLCPAPWPFRSRPAVQHRPRPLHLKSSRRPASSWRSAGSQPWHPPPHRSQRRRVVTAARPPPMGGREGRVLADRLPTAPPTLRAQGRTLPRLRRHSGTPHLLPSADYLKPTTWVGW